MTIEQEKEMSIERVKEYFRKYEMEERVREFDVSSATVELAAAALHCEPRRIAKTLSFMVDGHLGLFWYFELVPQRLERSQRRLPVRLYLSASE